MTKHANPTGREALGAARLRLARLGISPRDLLDDPGLQACSDVLGVPSGRVSSSRESARRVYASYWNRPAKQWGHRRMDEPPPSQIEALVEQRTAALDEESFANRPARVPDRLLSAILLEPLLGAHLQTEPLLGTMKEFAEVAMQRVVENYMSGDKDGAVTMLFRSVAASSRAPFGRAVWDVTSGMEGRTELIEAHPATVEEISTPVVWIGAAGSSPAFAESCAVLLARLPTTKAATIDGAGHYFPTLKPAETATTIDKPLRGQGSAKQV